MMGQWVILTIIFRQFGSCSLITTRGLELSYLSVYISLSVQFKQFTDKGYKEIMALSLTTNIKYAVRFRSTSVWGGSVS